ncbi:hypothetical protein [Streptomyces globisporus]|uniref:hypothetical protein n=1 Tax=Streptomyces globisporus TaxID=1908 RepID=UPI00345F6BB9|nr:hypothetical protein OG425_35260 [Streptomyces globisporus]
MTDARETNERRLRRLQQMRKTGSVAKASEALGEIWEAGKKPDPIVLRSAFLHAEGERSRLTKLVLPRGIALRLYLLAVFEAQCRLDAGDIWQSDRPLKGTNSWSTLVAIDGAYDTAAGAYDAALKHMPPELRGSARAEERWRTRRLEELKLRQVKGALKTLEELGKEDALVSIPRSARGHRSYEDFLLMEEGGRGDMPAPDLYTVSTRSWTGTRTITLPADFFLKGWIQVLNPSEVATWLILRRMSQWAPRKHMLSGVFLTARPRMQAFGLRDDAWEDGCRRLLEFGLIRYAEPPEGPEAAVESIGDPVAKALFSQPYHVRQAYEPHYWQLTDDGLAEDAVQKLDRELTHRRVALADATTRRMQLDPERLADHAMPEE